MYNIYLEFSAVEQERAKFMCDCVIKNYNNVLVSREFILAQSYYRYNKFEFVFQMLFNFISFCEKHKYKGKIEIIHNVDDLDYFLNMRSKDVKGTRKSFLKKYAFLITQGYGFKFIYDIDRACEENRAIKIKNISYEQSF